MLALSVSLHAWLSFLAAVLTTSGLCRFLSLPDTEAAKPMPCARTWQRRSGLQESQAHSSPVHSKDPQTSHIQDLHRQQILCLDLFHAPGLPYKQHSRQEEGLQDVQARVKLLVRAEGAAQSWGLGLPGQEQTLLSVLDREKGQVQTLMDECITKQSPKSMSSCSALPSPAQPSPALPL